MSKDIIWRNPEGQIHRDGDEPAIIYVNGNQEWYKKGEIHRDGDLPAIIYSNGEKAWYKNGNHHRDGDFPAIICSNGDKYWYKNGYKYIPSINTEELFYKEKYDLLISKVKDIIV